jgi:hypothetical protein
MLLAHPVLPPNPRLAKSNTYQLAFPACSAGTVQLGPDFILELRSRETGEIRSIIVEAMGSTDETYLAAKAVTHPRMAQIGPLVCVSPADVETGRIGAIVRRAAGA